MASEDGDEAPLSDVKFRLIESETSPAAPNGIPSVMFDASAFGSSSFKNATTVELYATADTWVLGDGVWDIGRRRHNATVRRTYAYALIVRPRLPLPAPLRSAPLRSAPLRPPKR